MLPELQDKNADINSIAEKALHDPDLLSELLGGLKLKVSPKSSEETIRYNCFKTLMLVSGSRGDVLYREWDEIAGQLRSQNSYHKMASVQLIANLTKADTVNKFEKVFDEYYGLLDDESVIVAIYVASASGRIVKAKPGLEPRVTERLLGIEQTHHLPGRKALVIAGAIEAFGQYVEQSAQREGITEFVRKQQVSESPKTRKLARDFLKKWENGGS